MDLMDLMDVMHGIQGTAPALAAEVPRHTGELARTGSTAEQLWLLGGVALSLTAAGVIAVAAVRGRNRDH
ncbi:hypothetical protein ACF08N_23990 [Streptomyces sp. NPDC015127]|uniref:hypothetical protein n=1 Tax=Streptomyces sp. NPDC015127 TaxID=3364939 RepID=UPI0036FA5587